MGKFRDGMPVKAEAVTLILSSLDRIKEILAGLEATEAEPEGNDHDLISQLEEMVERGMAAMSGSAQPMPSRSAQPALSAEPGAAAPARVEAASAAAKVTQGTLIDQPLERPLRPGEVSLDELERAFRETAIEAAAAHDAPAMAPAAGTPGAEKARAEK